MPFSLFCLVEAFQRLRHVTFHISFSLGVSGSLRVSFVSFGAFRGSFGLGYTTYAAAKGGVVVLIPALDMGDYNVYHFCHFGTVRNYSMSRGHGQRLCHK